MKNLTFIHGLIVIISMIPFFHEARTNKNQTLQSNPIESIEIIDYDKKIIAWKFPSMPEQFIDTLNFPLPSLERSVFEWKNENFIGIRSSCGSPCWHTYVFPLQKENDGVKRYFYTVGKDTAQNLIAYQPNDLEEEAMLRVENIKMNKFVDIKREICPATMTFLCIESIVFQDKTLRVYWKSDFFEGSDLSFEDEYSEFVLPEFLYKN